MAIFIRLESLIRAIWHLQIDWIKVALIWFSQVIRHMSLASGEIVYVCDNVV